MNIAFLVNVFPSTSETFVLNQITGLLDRGCTVTIFALSSQKDKVIHPDVINYGLLEKTVYLNHPQFNAVYYLKKFVKSFFSKKISNRFLFKTINIFKYGPQVLRLGIFKEVFPFIELGKSFDLLHCQFGNLGYKGVFLKELGATDAKVIVSMRGYDITKFVYENGEGVYKELFTKADLFLPVCEYFKTLLVRLGCPASKILVHHSGIDVKKFEFHPSAKSKSGEFKILTVGRLVEKKGIYYGLYAVKHLKAISPQLSFCYQIIGDGPLLEDLKQLAAELNIEEHVIFSGAMGQQDVVASLLASDVFLAPHVTASNQDQEGIPNVLKEAMAVGVPVVSTYHSGLPELVQDGVTGYLVQERDPEGLAEALLKVFNQSGNHFLMEQRAREYVEQKFNIENLNAELIRIYANLLLA
ncbi:glycosyltransferase [Rufibacter ruber]|uniref:glycosyltransferase n=1 Tax=Rufibacter ruber TaxID=1783499 RepID=UPI000829F231|nr:glycosyltransferase [Rufibacter ruber]